MKQEISLVGRVFRDFDGNGLMDTQDYGLEGLILESHPLNLSSITDRDGGFKIRVNLGNHTVRLPYLPQHHSLISPVDSSHIVSANNIGQVFGGLDFALYPTPNIDDLEATITPVTPVRPGFVARYQISCKNVGSTSQIAQIKFTHADTLAYNGSSIPYTAYYDSISTLVWDFGNLDPYESFAIIVDFIVPTNATPGMHVNSSVLVLPDSGDIEPWDNRDSLTQLITASFDPNDKQVLSPPEFSLQMLDNREPVSYLIRFQNTGTDTAFTVIVEDTLSALLDWSTFQMLDASHDYRLTVSEDGLFSWRFDYILLPDSNVNEAASHGFIRFEIIPRSDLLLGDTISNQASIFFDFNSPVLTNFTHTPVISTDAIEPTRISRRSSQLKIYPNPGNGYQKFVLDIPYSGSWNLKILDINGRRFYEENLILSPGKHEIVRELKSLPDGWYFVSFSDNQIQFSGMWIKRDE